MVELTIVRHGETEGNSKNLYQGWEDVPLNRKGIWQAERLALRLKDREFDRIYSSPLSRSLETAAAINRFHGLNIRRVNQIKEINFGEWENMSAVQIQQHYPGCLEEWRANWKEFEIPGGESLMAAYKRVTSWLNRLLTGNNKGNFLIVSHAGVIRAFISELVGRGIEGYWNYTVGNGSITCIRIYDGFPVMTLFNDTSHLED